MVFREEWIIADYVLESLVLDELGKCRRASQMTLRSCVQDLRVNFTDNIPKIKFAVGNVFDFFAANTAQIALVASSHFASLC